MSMSNLCLNRMWGVCIWCRESEGCGELHWVQVGDWSWAVQRAVEKDAAGKGGAIIVIGYWESR